MNEFLRAGEKKKKNSDGFVETKSDKSKLKILSSSFGATQMDQRIFGFPSSYGAANFTCLLSPFQTAIMRGSTKNSPLQLISTQKEQNIQMSFKAY